MKISNLNLISQPEVEFYFLTLAACHSVQIAQDQTKGASHLEYQASSPDEKALVEVAQRCVLLLFYFCLNYLMECKQQ